MAKRLVIDYGTDTLIDLDAPRENLGQRFNLGGLVRQKHVAAGAVPLISQTALRLLGTMGISAAAATKMAQENPTTFNTMLSNLLSGAGELAPSEVFKDKPKEEVERVQEVTQTDWKPSFKPEEPEPPTDPDPVGEVVEDVAISELIENFRKSKTKPGKKTMSPVPDYEKIDLIKEVTETFKKQYNRLPAYTELHRFFPNISGLSKLIEEGEIEILPEYKFRDITKQKVIDTKASDEYRTKMRDYAKERAVKENRLAVSEAGPFKDNPEVFYPKTITYDGKTYDAKKFFKDNLIKKATHGTRRKIGKTALSNEELAKLYNTNLRMVEKAIRVLRASPDWEVQEPPLVDRSIYGQRVQKWIDDANKKLSPSELENVKIQDNWVYDANQDIGNRSLKSVKKNKPQLIKELQWKLIDGVPKQVEREDEQLREDLKKFFSVNHNVKKSTEQFNVQTLVNRGLTTSKVNNFLNSVEGYIKNNPTQIRKIQGLEKWLRQRGLRIRIDGVSEELLDKLGKKNNFFGAEESPKGMFNSKTGKSIQWEKYLKFLDLALDGPEGVPLIKMGFAQGGVVPRGEYSEGTRMSPVKKKMGLSDPKDYVLGDSRYEDTLGSVKNKEGFAIKDKWGRAGDAVDIRNILFSYPPRLLQGGLNAIEISAKLPFVGSQLISDLIQSGAFLPGAKRGSVKEPFKQALENIMPTWGPQWGEMVGLKSLIDEQTGNMKKRGSSDAPLVVGNLLELGADVAMPLGYLKGAQLFSKFMEKTAKTPDQIMALSKNIENHLNSTGQSRRDFITLTGTMGLFGAMKAMGLDKVFNVGKVVKGTDGLIPMVKGTSQMPEWFPLFIQKIQPKLIYEGDGISTFKGTDDFLPGMEITKTGDDYVITGKNEYDGNWSVSYEGPRWLEIEPGQKPTYFSGEFQVADEAPYMVGPDDYDWDIVTHDTIDDILGGNGRSMEEFAKGTKIEGLTKGEKQVDWAEGRFQSEMDMANEDY